MPVDSRLRDAVLFYLLALGMATAVALLAPALGDGVLLLTMFTPLAAVLAVRLLVVRDGWTLKAWADIGLHRPGFRYWPLALILPLIVILPGYLLLWGTETGRLAVAADVSPPREAMRLAIAILAGAALGALGEEVGWRGYLLPRLMPLGRWPAMFATGFLHGVWHLPLILLTPFYHSAGTVWITVVLFLATLTLAGGVYGTLRIASASIWPVALAHRALNTYWDRLDTMTQSGLGWLKDYVAGESGIAVIVTLALVLLVLRRWPVADGWR